MPADVEGGELGKELQLATGQGIEQPPGERLPVAGFLITRQVPGQDDRGDGAHRPVGIAPVPDVTGVILVVLVAIAAVGIAVAVDSRRAEGRADLHRAEGVVQGLEDVLA